MDKQRRGAIITAVVLGAMAVAVYAVVVLKFMAR
jgi:hypothetical protein